jgi:restriction system protein
MAKSRGLLADLQRELARRQRAEQQRVRMQAQAAARAIREHEQALRKAARDAAATEKERQRLYVEERKAEAASKAASLQARISELDSVLTAGVRQPPLVTFCLAEPPCHLPGIRRRRPGSPVLRAALGAVRPRPRAAWARCSAAGHAGNGKRPLRVLPANPSGRGTRRRKLTAAGSASLT